MMSTVPIICQSSAAAVELEMDMEVKSEPESEEESLNCNLSVTSSVEELSKSEQSQSDEEELEEEPLVEIEAITVPQQLVEVELEPTLLLFVNKDYTKSFPSINSENHSNLSKEINVSSNKNHTETPTDQDLEGDKTEKLSITKVLRSVKREKLKNHCPNSFIQSEANKLKMPDKSNLVSERCQSYTEYPSPEPQSRSVSNIEQNNIPSPTSKLKFFNKNIKARKVKLLTKVNNNKKNHLMIDHSETKNGIKSAFQKKKTHKKPLAKRNRRLLPSSKEIEDETYDSDENQKEKENTQNNDALKTSETALNEDNEKVSLLIRDEVEISNKDEIDNRKSTKLIKNLSENARPESYDCTVCGKKFREKSHLATHARAHIDIRNYKCGECGNRFKTKANLYFHMKTHEEAPFVCTKCNKTFPEKKMFTRHMRVVHSGEGLYNCDQCGRSFKSAQNLELHYTLHTGNKPFSCTICGKTFVYKSTYRAHMKAHDADEAFSCELCPSDVDRGELRRRCNHHSQARPWLCTVCGKGYPLKGTLKNHMKSHEPEKPYKCEECGKFFMKRQTFESHMKMHSGENPQYMCDQCSQSYYNVFALKRHYMKHTSERKFVCDTCNKAFWTKDALKVHRRSHENIKMFQCTQCSKAFAHKHTLVAHLRSHTGETLHSCDICSKTFVQKYHLTRHQRQHSSNPPPTHTIIPLTPSLITLAPHSHHLDMPTLQIL